MPEFVTHVGAELAVVGGLPQLGSWDATHALKLVWAPGHRWSADVALPEGWAGSLEYKVGSNGWAGSPWWDSTPLAALPSPLACRTTVHRAVEMRCMARGEGAET